ncbi:MAG: alginate export family protein [Terriglobia bacterium]
MRAGLRWVGVCLVVGLGVAPARAESPGSTLEERLAALERRVEQLETENHELKTQVARMVPSAAPPAVEVASASTGAAGGIAAPPKAMGLPVNHPSSPAASLQASSSPIPQVSAEKGKSERIEVGGQLRFRAEVRQNADLNSSISDLADFVAQRLRFHIRAKLSDQIETYLQFQDSRLWGQELATNSNDNLTDLHQGYFQVSDFLKPGLSLRAGRQEMAYGSDRLIGRGNWDNVGRSFDAVKMGYTSKTWGSDWFAAKIVDRRQTGRGDRDQYLYGIYNQFFRQQPRHLDVYGILLRDGLRTPGEIPAEGRKATEIMTAGLRSDGKLGRAVDYDVEFADQFGHRGFDPHSARAFAGMFYGTLEETHQLRLGFEYDVATGDRDPKDGRSGEFYNLFPSNHPHYGYADLMGWRNMQDFRPMFTVAPVKNVKFDIDYHRFYLLAARGPWKNASGAVLGFDPTGNSGTHVGDEVDFTLAFPVHKHLTILSGYSLFVPGEFAQKTRGEDNQHFVYLQTLVDF